MKRAKQTNRHNGDKGFTAVELLVTIFVAALFLSAGYQLFSVILQGGSDGRSRANAVLIAANYVQQYEDSATSTCAASNPLSNSSLTIDGLTNPVVSVSISCPVASAPSLSKIQASVTYGDDVDRITVTKAVYVNKS